MNTTYHNSFKVQQYLTVIVLMVFVIKIFAWYQTQSVSILSDTVEYIINVIASFVGLYSLYVAAKPRDKDHPYGHGRIEFLSAALEGTLMIVSAGVIIYHAFHQLKNPVQLSNIQNGLIITIIAAVLNFVVGQIVERKGNQNNSLQLIAAGKHMKSDTYTTIGVIIGLIILKLTNWQWIDSVMAIIVSLLIIYSGYQILRSSVAGIMDEADEALLEEVVSLLNKNRVENWVDLHNLRIIKYGSILHLDCHITIPWYFTIHQGHDEVKRLEDLVKKNFGESVELFVHTDGCLDFSCKVCSKSDCTHRTSNQTKHIEWTVHNISSNNKHQDID